MNKFIFLLLLLLPIGPSTHAVAQELAVESFSDSDGPVTRTLVWPDGTRYIGGVLDGKRSGKGTIFWQDGTRFVGQFENDKRNGPGTMILPDGTVYTGFFENDELVDTESSLAQRQQAQELNDAEATAALGDTELPIEADSLTADTRQDPIPVSEDNDLPPVSADETSAEEPTDIYARSGSRDQEGRNEDLDAVFDDAYSSDVTAVTDAVTAELKEAINLWSAAWSDQNVPQYLANYSDSFEVPSDRSRRSWEALRQSRLTKPQFISVEVDFEDFELVDTNVVDVFFRQAYRSNTYSDQTNKVLRLRKEGTNWKILIERSR